MPMDALHRVQKTSLEQSHVFRAIVKFLFDHFGSLFSMYNTDAIVCYWS
jgi:hypothetical protein